MNDCSLNYLFFHIHFVQQPLVVVMNFESDINKTIDMVLIVKQELFCLLCRFALQYLDEGCLLMHTANYTVYHYLG